MTRNLFRTLFPRASKDTEAANTYDDHTDIELQNTQLERDQAAALGCTTEGETQSVGRVKVSFIGYRCRPLDPDNFAGGCKDLLDGLRHAGLIPGDEPWRIYLYTEQEKVAHRGEERTQIVIEYP